MHKAIRSFAVSSTLLALPAAAQTFAPAVVASIKDSPRDGQGDAFNLTPFEGLLRKVSSIEDRAIQEFAVGSLSGATIQSATLSGSVHVNNAFDNGPRTFAFSLYAGNGAADVTDFQIAATLVGTGVYHPPIDASFAYSFDVTGALQALISAGNTHVGLRVDCTSEPNYPNILGVTLSQLDVSTAACGTSVSYCTAGTTSSGCNVALSSAGTPSGSSGSGFTVTASTVEGDKSGILFYGINGRQAVPWAPASTSYLCLVTPTQRGLPQNSGGTAGVCDGSLALDWNAFVAANPGALGTPFTGGETVQIQAWFRDPPAPRTTNLSNALEFVTCP